MTPAPPLTEERLMELLNDDKKHTLDLVGDLLARERQGIKDDLAAALAPVGAVREQIDISNAFSLLLLESYYYRGIITPADVDAMLGRQVQAGAITEELRPALERLMGEFSEWRRERKGGA